MKLTKTQESALSSIKEGLTVDCKEATLKSLVKKGAIKSYKIDRVEFLGDFKITHYAAKSTNYGGKNENS